MSEQISQDDIVEIVSLAQTTAVDIKMTIDCSIEIASDQGWDLEFDRHILCCYSGDDLVAFCDGNCTSFFS